MKSRYSHMMGQISMDKQAKEAMLTRLSQAEQQKNVEKNGNRRIFTAASRRVLLAACLAGALAVGALAASLSGGWAQFFGGVPEGVSTPVWVSAKSGDYTITLEETIVDQDGAAFLISLKRTDGGVLKGEPQLYGMRLDIANELASMGFDYQAPILSEDGTAIYYCFQFKNYNKDIEALVGHEIIIGHQGVIDKNWTEEEFEQIKLETVSLAPLASVLKQSDVNFSLYADMEDPNFVTAMDQLNAIVVPGTLPLSKHSEKGFSLAGGILSQDGMTLALALYQPEGEIREENYLTKWADIAVLSDSRTGKSVGTGAQWGCDPGYGITLFKLDRPMTTEDLPYLEATVQYDTVKLLSDKPFTLAFTVADNGYIKEYILNQQVEVAFRGFGHRYDFHATALHISALELQLFLDTIESAEKELSEETSCKLIYDDGEEVALKGGVSLSVVNRLERDRYLTFRPVENILFEPDRAVALQIGDTRIDLK